MKPTALFSITLATIISTTPISSSPAPLSTSKRQQNPPSTNPICSAPAAPTSRRIRHAIQRWKSDIIRVNIFLDNASGDDDFHAQASATLNGPAKDELFRLGILACIPALNATSEAFLLAAANDFGPNFLEQLRIVAEAEVEDLALSDPRVVGAYNAINDFRCRHYLPGIARLWEDAADVVDISRLDTRVPRPDVC